MGKNIIPHDYQISIKDRRKSNKHSSFLLWFTGLSGSGKSTIANVVEQKLYKQEERLTMLDRKQMTSARTPLAGAVDTGAPHQKAFNAYLRSGDDDGLRGLEMEVKSLSTAVNSDGGYLVDPQTANTVKSVPRTPMAATGVLNRKFCRAALVPSPETWRATP